MSAADTPTPGRARTVLHGTVRLLSGQLFARLLDMALYLVLARRLGVSAFGAFTYAVSFTLLFNVATDLGLTTVFTREAARAPHRIPELLQRTLGLKAVLAPITLVLVLGVARLLGTPNETLLLMAVLGVSMTLGSAAGLFEGLLRAQGRPGLVGVSLAAASATSCVIVLLALAWGLTPWLAAWAQCAAQVVHLAVAAWGARQVGRDTAAVSAGESPVPSRRALLREALPLALSWVFIALYFRIDAVMLHAMRDEHAVGLYGGIYRFFEAFAMLTVGFRSVMFPFLARAADGPAEGLAVLCRKSLRLQLLFTVLVAVSFGFLGRPLLTFVLGPAYAEAAPGLAILMWALPGSFMADTLLHVLIAQRRQSLGTWAVGATALLNVGLNLVWIPRASYLGASAATVVSEATCFALLFMLFRRGVPRVGLARDAWRPLVAGLALAAMLALGVPHLPQGVGGMLLGFVLAAAGYVGVLALLGEFRGEAAGLYTSLVPARFRPRAEVA